MTTSPPPSRILIVDDEVQNRRLLDALLKSGGHVTESAGNGEEALKLVASFRPDLILLDIMLPGIDGFEVASRLKLDPATHAIPIIMVTTLDDRDSRMRALQIGAEEFIQKPVDRAELWVRVRNLLRLRELNRLLEEHNRLLERQVRERSAQLTVSYRETIRVMSRAASYRDEETGAHVRRISHYCVELGTALGLDADYCDCLYYASPMHDVGKIGIPEAVLQKPGRLTVDEWEVMKAHTTLGAKMLEGGESPYLAMGREIALSHHECWDGTGYPQGLAGEAIPLAARIMQLADIYDTLRSQRPYKPAFNHTRALEIIARGDGRVMPGHIDPQIMATFGRCAERWREIHDSNADGSSEASRPGIADA